MKLNKTEARINKNGKLSVGSEDKKMLTIINPIKGTLDEKLLGVIKNLLEVNNTYIFKVTVRNKHYYCTCIAPQTDTDIDTGNLYMYEDIQCATDKVYPMSDECVKELIFGKDITIAGAIRKGIV